MENLFNKSTETLSYILYFSKLFIVIPFTEDALCYNKRGKTQQAS